MKGLFLILLSIVASYASIMGLYFTIIPLTAERPVWHWVLVLISIATMIFLVWREVADFLRTSPKTFKDRQKINDYMCRWVSNGGRVVIFSRDMSWAESHGIQSILFEKATRNELTICLEHSIPLTEKLAQCGANIITYQQLGHVPRSRFTIVDFGKEGARVAVGVPLNGRHVIQEFKSGDHPFFAVAEDLVKFLMSMNARNSCVS